LSLFLLCGLNFERRTFVGIATRPSTSRWEEYEYAGSNKVICTGTWHAELLVDEENGKTWQRQGLAIPDERSGFHVLRRRARKTARYLSGEVRRNTQEDIRETPHHSALTRCVLQSKADQMFQAGLESVSAELGGLQLCVAMSAELPDVRRRRDGICGRSCQAGSLLAVLFEDFLAVLVRLARESVVFARSSAASWRLALGTTLD
jgi:hypothetical protein